MTVNDVIDSAFRVLKSNLRTVVTVASVFIVPLALLAAFLQRELLGGIGFIGMLNDPSTAAAAADTGGSNAAPLVSLIGQSLSLPLIAAALARVVGGAYMGGAVSAGAALATVARRSWILVPAWVFVHVVEIVGGVLLLAPGVAAMTFFLVTAPVIGVEGLGPVAAMRRSTRLVRRRFWPVLGMAMLAGIIGYALRQAIVAVPTMVGLLIGLDRGWVIVGVGNVVALLVAQSLTALIAVLVYFDARIRVEGFDLQVMATVLERRERA